MSYRHNFLVLTYDIKNYFLSIFISVIFDILHRIMTFSEGHSVFFVGVKNDITSEIWSFDVIFNVVCELFQPMGKTKFSSTT